MSDIAWPLLGHDLAEKQFLEAATSGHLHHGWLIEGPSGIGKSILARRMTAYILGAQMLETGRLDSANADPVVQKINASSHPDLKWLSRRPDEKGKVKQDIPVDEIRSLNQFFALKSALGGWRVGIIDSLDELNRNGANALLKTLEEPPKNCLLILVSHGTRAVLPTIKSRCRSLRMNALNSDDTLAALKLAKTEDARAAAKLARGRPGLGLSLSTVSGMSASSAVRSYLRALPKPSDSLLAQVIRSAGVDATSFDAFTGEILDWLAEEASVSPNYSETWLSMSRLISEQRALNMDRTQSAAAITSSLQRAAQER